MKSIQFVGITLGMIVAFGVLYLSGMGTQVGFIDHGELLAAQYHWGIAHATGYPLFTLLGHLWSKLPLGNNMVFQLNLISMLYCLGFLAVWIVTVRFILQKITESSESQTVIVSAFATGLIGIHPIIWEQAESAEVYSLHLLLFSLVLHTLIKAYYSQTTKSWVLFAVAVGFSFANHLTTLLIFPAAAYCYFFPWEASKLAEKLKRLALLGVLAAVITFSFYLCLFLLACILLPFLISALTIF